MRNLAGSKEKFRISTERTSMSINSSPLTLQLEPGIKSNTWFGDGQWQVENSSMTIFARLLGHSTNMQGPSLSLSLEPHDLHALVYLFQEYSLIKENDQFLWKPTETEKDGYRQVSLRFLSSPELGLLAPGSNTLLRIEQDEIPNF